ncbi:RHTO0S13e01618g1_1 [Rhodotorula toruloides]|uniref:RHTO0S13e01618g1_1 n=1 Tax=Rhodotorula toruloides TaxID=5286 RepID=A0A061BA13_RHOTO|nr:RHTO0S13e01618g1_1 [Rhodotorula toruloides]
MLLRIRRDPHTLYLASLSHHKSPQPTRSFFSRMPLYRPVLYQLKGQTLPHTVDLAPAQASRLHAALNSPDPTPAAIEILTSAGLLPSDPLPFDPQQILRVEKAADVDFCIVTKPTDTEIAPRSLLSRLVDRLDKALDERDHEREVMTINQLKRDKGAMLRTTVLNLAAERNIILKCRAPADYESELDYLVAETSLTNVLLNPIRLRPIWQGFHQSRLNVVRPELSEERFGKWEAFSREDNIAGILKAAKIVSAPSAGAQG